MATAGIIKGRDVKIYFATVVVDDQVDLSLNVSADLLEITTKQSSGYWKEFTKNLQGATGSVNGYYSMDATEGVTQALSDLVAGTSLAVVMKTGVSGDDELAFSAIINSIDLAYPLTGIATFSFAFTVTGAITETTAS